MYICLGELQSASVQRVSSAGGCYIRSAPGRSHVRCMHAEDEVGDGRSGNTLDGLW